MSSSQEPVAKRAQASCACGCDKPARRICRGCNTPRAELCLNLAPYADSCAEKHCWECATKLPWVQFYHVYWFPECCHGTLDILRLRFPEHIAQRINDYVYGVFAKQFK